MLMKCSKSEIRRLDCQFGKQYFKKPVEASQIQSHTPARDKENQLSSSHHSEDLLSFQSTLLEIHPHLGPRNGRKVNNKNWINYVLLLKLKLRKGTTLYSQLKKRTTVYTPQRLLGTHNEGIQSWRKKISRFGS